MPKNKKNWIIRFVKILDIMRLEHNEVNFEVTYVHIMKKNIMNKLIML